MRQLRGSDCLEALSQTLNLGAKEVVPTFVQVRIVEESAASRAGANRSCRHHYIARSARGPCSLPEIPRWTPVSRGKASCVLAA